MHVPSSHKCAANLLAMAINCGTSSLTFSIQGGGGGGQQVCSFIRLFSFSPRLDNYAALRIYLRITYYIDHCINLMQQQLGLPRVLVIKFKLKSAMKLYLVVRACRS